MRLPIASVLCLIFAASIPSTLQADFKTEGVAFLKTHCVVCHGEKKKNADVALHTFTDEASLLKDRKLWQSVLRVVESGEMPPKPKPKPTVAELDGFKKSVTAAFANADKNAKPDPGRITVRRLNKTEYTNTVRDLIGVDFNPAEDFPADDIGYGFDNIADVLTISPVLMERYLAAAEAITSQAIMTNIPKPTERWMGGKYLEPATNPEKVGKFRTIADKNLNTPYSLPLDGDYTFRFRAYATKVGDEALKVSVTFDGKDVKAFSIPGGDEKSAAVYEVKLPLTKGNHRAAVTIINPLKDKDGKERTLNVDYFYLSGPADMRSETHKRLLACDSTKSKRDQTKEILQRFATRAFRRPATAEEVERLVKLVEASEAAKMKPEAAIQLAMQAVLVSPKFLFRIELDDRPDSNDPHPIGEYPLASRLSYFLWASMPDAELFDLAAKKQLSTNLDAQVKRMLKDPKAKTLVDNFVMQWLQLKRLSTLSPDQKMFKDFNEQLRSAMVTETRMFFEELVREDRSILDIIDGNYTYLNGRLSGLYGIADTKGSDWNNKLKTPGSKEIPWEEFVRVELPKNHARGGILTQASILTVTSNPTRTSPVKRGRWVLEQVLGTPPPPPPPEVPELKEDKDAISSGSLRKRMEEHRKNVACAGCHQKMDDMGFAFENFNAIGGYRWKDGDFDIDPAGVLPDGAKFKNPQELKSILKGKSDLISRNLAEKMLIYATGRGLEWYDNRTLDAIVAGTRKGDFKFSALVAEVVKSDPFRLRRGKAQEAAGE
jgi:Protein of unknown function (DUF1592)/Protein of unknown function (DUF1588)/Protein of unknown function (DUF1587)/Protein of unknown function (DUF1585)/Protein of unknown function (DUF1595)/Planctomycete cytochrome C